MHIIERRKIFYIISLILIIPGLISLFTQGLNLGIDFQGGSITQVNIGGKVTVAEVRATVADLGLERAEITRSGNEFFIRTPELNQEETKELLGALEKKFVKVEFLSAESVGATIGKELTNKAILATIIAALAMLIYISLRFEWTFGVAAIVSEIHDILFVLGLFSLLQWEINTPFIAAILTIDRKSVV